jgi:hypothetical protein
VFFLCERRRRRRIQSARCASSSKYSRERRKFARPPHGGGASGGVLSLRAAAAAADSKRDARAAPNRLCCNQPVGQRVRGISKASYAWRIAATVLGIGLLLNGSLRMSDDAWPFGPLSQYAFSPAKDTTIVITRAEGLLADGRRIDLPLRVETAGISRAEIEARIPQITADPSLLRSVADGWSSRHREEPPLIRVWLVQDQTRLVDGRVGPTRLVELTAWEPPS